MDSELRILERRALIDPSIQPQLAAAHCRINQHCWHQAPGMGYMAICNSKFVCCNCGNYGRLVEDYCAMEEAKCGPYAPTVAQGNWVSGRAKPGEDPFKVPNRWRCNYRIEPCEFKE